MFSMPDALPRALADYLATSAGQYMTHDATYFSWSLADRKIYVAGNVHPDQHPSPYHEAEGCITFVRSPQGGWQRWQPRS